MYSGDWVNKNKKMTVLQVFKFFNLKQKCSLFTRKVTNCDIFKRPL